MMVAITNDSKTHTHKHSKAINLSQLQMNHKLRRGLSLQNVQGHLQKLVLGAKPSTQKNRVRQPHLSPKNDS